MDPLATTSDVVNVLQRSLTTSETSAAEGDANSPGLLAAASDLFRAESRQQFTPGQSTVRLKVNGGRVRLDQQPAGDVLAAVDDDGNPVDYTRTGMWLTVPHTSGKFITVTYMHGSETVPARVRTAVAEMVARALIVPEEVMAGARSLTDSAGQVSQTTAWSVRAPNSGLQMSDSDKTLAKSFHWPGGQVIVQAP